MYYIILISFVNYVFSWQNIPISQNILLQHHSAIQFKTWNLNDQNNLCLGNECGVLCTTSDSTCSVPSGTNPNDGGIGGRQNLQSPTTNNGISTTTGECDDTCCQTGSGLQITLNETCFRTMNKNGNNLQQSTNEDVLLIFGGQQNNNLNIPLSDYCNIGIQKTCTQSYTNDLWLYFVQQNTWSKVTPGKNSLGSDTLPSERSSHSSVYVEIDEVDSFTSQTVKRKYMYIFGGFSTDCTNGACNDLWRYEISWAAQRYYPQSSNSNNFWNRGNHWTKITPATQTIPPARGESQMVIDQAMQNLYIFGGNIVDDQGNSISNDMWQFSLSTLTWTQINYQEIQSIQRTIKLWDGSLFLKSIQPENRLISDQVIYNSPNFNQPSQQICAQNSIQIPDCRAKHQMVLINNILYLFGGYSVSRGNYTYVSTTNLGEDNYYNDMWTYDFNSNIWLKKYFPSTTIIPTPRSGHGLIYYQTKQSIDYLFLYGGNNENQVLNDLWFYKLESSTWFNFSETHFESVPTENYYPGASKGHVLIRYSQGFMLIGGSTFNTNQNSLQQFNTNCPSMITYNDFLFQKSYNNLNQNPCYIDRLSIKQQYPYPYKYNQGINVLTETESCHEDYSQRGTCLFGRLECNNQYFGSQCQNTQCPNSYCYYDKESLSPATCQFCSGQGNCQNGKCGCNYGYVHDDCSIVDCPNNCSNTADYMVGVCQIQFPQSVCLCDESLKRGGDDCSKIFCLNDCSNHGICEQGTCVCDTGFVGFDCSMFGINLENNNGISMMNQFYNMKYMSDDNILKLSKMLFGTGIIFVLIFPKYAYYWKNTTMERQTEGITKDLERVYKKGRNISDIPKAGQYNHDDDFDDDDE